MARPTRADDEMCAPKKNNATYNVHTTEKTTTIIKQKVKEPTRMEKGNLGLFFSWYN
jgi:cephalosporin-C deacetylase-like acetyl esterase